MPRFSEVVAEYDKNKDGKFSLDELPKGPFRERFSQIDVDKDKLVTELEWNIMADAFAKAENAVIMPAFLARVPRRLPLDAPLSMQCERGIPVLEAITQRATAQGVEVDSRVARGRSYRDALEHLLDEEQFDRIIVSATANPHTGLSKRDLEWLLERVPAEVLILRPAPADERRISAAGVIGHF